MSMTDYIIEMLSNASFDKEIFVRELNKSRRWLNQEEWNILMRWVRKNHMDKIMNTDLRYSLNSKEHIFR